MLKKQKFNLSFLHRLILLKSLVVIFATGLFAVNSQGNYFSNNKNESLLLRPIKNLNDEQYDQFMLGRSFFTIPWVESPSATTARDGLGPLFNANTCVSCHPRNGRGTLYNKKGNASRSLVARLSIPSNGSVFHEELKKKKGFIPEPVYGDQIALNGIHGVPFEAKIKIDFDEIKVKFPDGETDFILKPKYELVNKNYGSLHKDVNITYRIANSMHGLGLLELVSNEEILSNEDKNDLDNDGISGKANWVYSFLSKKVELGRYTWKASSSSLIEQISGAARNDMGLTSFLNKDDTCTVYQKECLDAPKSFHSLDISDERLGAIDFYIKSLKVYKPINDKNYKEGLTLFKSFDCAKCHKTSLKTINGFEIAPFTDLLLHDMGEGLSDGRVEFQANKNEFRTAPLWGLSLHKLINKKNARLLHDGRARNFQEAILWHGGEAKKSKEKYMNASKEDRKKLIKFLERL